MLFLLTLCCLSMIVCVQSFGLYCNVICETINNTVLIQIKSYIHSQLKHTVSQFNILISFAETALLGMRSTLLWLMLANIIYLHKLHIGSMWFLWGPCFPEKHCVNESPAVLPKAKHLPLLNHQTSTVPLFSVKSPRWRLLFFCNMDWNLEACFSGGHTGTVEVKWPHSDSVTQFVLDVPRHSKSHNLLVTLDWADCSHTLLNGYLKG